MWSLKVKINHHSSTKFSFLFVEVEVKIQVHVLLTAIVVVVMVVDMVAILVVVMMVLMKKTKTFQPQSTPSPSSLCISSIVISKDLLWFVPPFLNIATVNCLKSLSSASFLVFFAQVVSIAKLHFWPEVTDVRFWCPHYTYIVALKGKLGEKIYRLKVFIWPLLREVSIGNFNRKAPKLVKNQVKGSKIDQIRTKQSI